MSEKMKEIEVLNGKMYSAIRRSSSITPYLPVINKEKGKNKGEGRERNAGVESL